MNDQLTTITGRLGKDPFVVMRNTKKGRKAVAKFSLATNVLSDNGMETVWWQISAWDKVGDLCAKNLHKGDPVQLHGFGHKQQYNSKKYGLVDTLQFTAVFVTFLSKKEEEYTGTPIQERQNLYTAGTRPWLPGLNPF